MRRKLEEIREEMRMVEVVKESRKGAVKQTVRVDGKGRTDM
jgi:hypothetical protein